VRDEIAAQREAEERRGTERPDALREPDAGMGLHALPADAAELRCASAAEDEDEVWGPDVPWEPNVLQEPDARQAAAPDGLPERCAWGLRFAQVTGARVQCGMRNLDAKARDGRLATQGGHQRLWDGLRQPRDARRVQRASLLRRGRRWLRG
jgi:hypothetical protein